MKKILSCILLFTSINYSNAQKMPQKEYVEQAKYIWENFVPKSGQAEYVQGELLRALEKLRDEAQRNGNGNFYKKCHKAFLKYLKEKLSDEHIFDKEMIKQINRELDKLSHQRQPYIEDDVYDYLSDRIVDWYLYYGNELRHAFNTNLQC
ncbi:hypothetical protein [Namhaeicola litoreus]|uniref:Uncharacterized protein n=1 Tax=Namhaeicola litoreus TaxID=1052145 RepID=A0ABW3XYK2_9FLAO